MVETVCLCRCCCGVCKLTLRNLCLYIRILRLYIDSFERERGGGKRGREVFIDNQQVTEGRRLWEVTWSAVEIKNHEKCWIRDIKSA